jgi:pimeloyl-ACP methyl ester carboxylesterase
VGEGDNVVLIHGLGANHGFWHLNALLPLARHYRVIVYDLRGHGYSGMPSSGYTSADMAEDLNHLLNHLGISQAHIIGHSFGGTVALHFAYLHPDRVTSVVVADSRVRALQSTNRAKDLPNWQHAKKAFKEIGLDVPEEEPEMGLWLLEKLALPQWQQKRQELKGRQIYIPFSKLGGGNRSAERFCELLNTTTARQDVLAVAGLTTENLTNIRCPALLIYGRRSQLMSSYYGLESCLTYCKSILISEADHFFPVTHPEIFVNMVRDFLEDVQGKERRKVRRFLFNLPVELRNNATRGFAVSTLNISQKGLLIESLKKLEVGCEIEIIASLDQKNQPVNIKGKVIRIAEDPSIKNYQFGIELSDEGSGYTAWKNFVSA